MLSLTYPYLRSQSHIPHCLQFSWESHLQNKTYPPAQPASPTACLFSISLIPFIFLVCSLVWNAQEEFLYLRNMKLKNVCNFRVLVESEIKERGETWQSCITHYSWAFTSGEKLEYAAKSNIECNSGISKDIWCHKSMYYYIWIYKYLFISVLLPFIFIVVYGGVMIVFKKCRIQKILLFLLDKLFCKCLCNIAFTYPVYACLLCIVLRLQNIIWKC